MGPLPFRYSIGWDEPSSFAFRQIPTGTSTSKIREGVLTAQNATILQDIVAFSLGTPIHLFVTYRVLQQKKKHFRICSRLKQAYF